MGRAKLKLHKLDGSNRIGVYSRRKKGLLKKANELSILCDIDIFLAMFSPGGKPSVYKSENSSFEDLIAKFAEINPEERAKRKMECFETIKKACKKSDHDVNIGEQQCPGDLTAADINFLSHSLELRLSDIEGRLRLWKNLDKIDSIQQLRKMENSILNSLNEISRHQVFQPSSVQHGMTMPSNFDSRNELHPCSTVHVCDSENMDSYDDRSSFYDNGYFQPSSQMQDRMNVGQDFNQCSSVHGDGNSEIMDVFKELNSFRLQYLEQPSFSVESYTNLVGNKEIEGAKPEYENFIADEIFLDCQLNQEDIETEFGFTFDVPQFDQPNDSSNLASGTCHNMMLADSLNFLRGMDSLSSNAGEEFSTSTSIKHGTNLPSTQLDPCLSAQTMEGYMHQKVFDSSLKLDDALSIQHGMNSAVSFHAEQELHQSSSLHGGDSESIDGYEDLNTFVQGFLEDPSLSVESFTDHEVEKIKSGYDECSWDKMFPDWQVNQEDVDIALRCTLDLPVAEKVDVQESTFECVNISFGLPQLRSIIA